MCGLPLSNGAMCGVALINLTSPVCLVCSGVQTQGDTFGPPTADTDTGADTDTRDISRRNDPKPPNATTQASVVTTQSVATAAPTAAPTTQPMLEVKVVVVTATIADTCT